jgi:hypothetical protein
LVARLAPRVPAPAELDPGRLLGLLTARGVDYVLIGGLASVLYGSATLTQDVDICFARDEANLEALAKALGELGARLRGVGESVPFVPDRRTLEQAELLTLETSAGPLDLVALPPGAPPYEVLRRRAQRLDLGAFAVSVASLEDLIEMKRIAGRPKDLIAIEELQAIRRLRGSEARRRKR